MRRNSAFRFYIAGCFAVMVGLVGLGYWFGHGQGAHASSAGTIQGVSFDQLTLVETRTISSSSNFDLQPGKLNYFELYGTSSGESAAGYVTGWYDTRTQPEPITFSSTITNSSFIARDGVTLASAAGVNTSDANYIGGLYSIDGSEAKNYGNAKFGNAYVRIREYTVALEYQSFAVEPPQNKKGYMVSQPGTKTVMYGGSCSLVLSSTAGFNNTRPDVSLSQNGEIQYVSSTGDDHRYTIFNVTGPILAGYYTVDVTLNTYKVSAPQDDTGYSFSQPTLTDVQHGGNYSFSVTLGETHSRATPVISVGDRGTVELTDPETFTFTVFGVMDTISPKNFTVVIPRNTYTVAFDLGMGIGITGISPIIVEHGRTIQKPSDPKYAGYTFGGWYTSEDFDTEWRFIISTVTRDLVLHAKWVPGESVVPGDSNINNLLWFVLGCVLIPLFLLVIPTVTVATRNMRKS